MKRFIVCVIAITFAPLSYSQNPKWTQVDTPVAPSPRTDHAMAYDMDREEVVLFGGLAQDRSERLGDTWIWNGSEWRLAATEGPGARWQHQMAYDVKRKKIVLYGNFDSLKRDTWEWDGSQWTQANSGNSVLYVEAGHAMTYDPMRQQVILFGGFLRHYEGIAYSYSTCGWDGSTWKLIDLNGPEIQYGYALVNNINQGKTYLLSGMDDFKMWLWDGDVWDSEIQTPLPTTTSFEAVYDLSRNKMVIFGGIRNEEKIDETWEWDGAEWTQIDNNNPPPRTSHAMVYDAAREQIVLFGGSNDKPYGSDEPTRVTYGDTWVYGVDSDVGKQSWFSYK